MHPALKAENNRALALFEPYLTNITIWQEWPPRLAEAGIGKISKLQNITLYLHGQ